MMIRLNSLKKLTDLLKIQTDMIFNLYKPKDFSSFDIVKKVKYITKEKVGHSGTLDPFADGVLVLGVGKSTKKLSDIIQFDKTYEGIIKLGEKTDSMDLPDIRPKCL